MRRRITKENETRAWLRACFAAAALRCGPHIGPPLCTACRFTWLPPHLRRIVFRADRTCGEMTAAMNAKPRRDGALHACRR
jgi:hypothetical protein